MQTLAHSVVGSGSVVFLVGLLWSPGGLRAQPSSLPPAESGKARVPLNWSAQQDHKNMMEQLGIVRLRPGPSGQPGATNSANYDPAKANPFPDLPEILTLKNGQKVITPEMWWKQRRPEIVEDFDREIYGRVPKVTPKVNWEVTSTTREKNGDIPVITRKLVGHV